MKVSFTHFLRFAPLFLVLFAACGGGGGGTPPTPTLSSIVVAPGTSTIARGSSQQFTATALDADGNPLSGISFIWSSSNEGAAQVDQTGLAQGVSEGSVMISASAGAISGKAPLEVSSRIFSDSATHSAGKNPQAIAVGDFDGDGSDDLAVANADDNSLTVLKGSGGGAFSQPNIPLQTGPLPFAVASGHFSGDPYEDLAIANLAVDPNLSSISTFIGGPSGAGSGPGTDLPGHGPISIAIADFTGDNNNDIATANLSSQTISIIRGNGDSTFPGPHPDTTPVGGGPIALVAGDLNGDAMTDLTVVLGGATGEVVILLGIGNGTFPSRTTIAVGANPNAIASGDWDGNGTTDLVVVNSGSRNLTLLFGDGTGQFPNLQVVSLPGGGSPLHVVSGHFGGDDRPDLAVSNRDNNTVSILLNDGNGVFGTPIGHSVGREPLAMAVGDFNGDNLDDLAVANSQDDSVSVFLQLP